MNPENKGRKNALSSSLLHLIVFVFLKLPISPHSWTDDIMPEYSFICVFFPIQPIETEIGLCIYPLR